MPGVSDSAGPLRTRTSVRSRVVFWVADPMDVPETSISKLNTLPAYPLFYASMVASRHLIAKLGAERIVTPYS